MKTKSLWRSMQSAPKDGTLILITETPNGEAFNVMPAMWCNLNLKSIGWWAVDGAHWSDEGDLHTRFKPIACIPLCWMPFPQMDSISTLRRRMAQLYKEGQR